VTAARTCLPAGLAAPAPSRDGLDTPFWEAARRHELLCQRCRACGGFQWGPEWICHRCRSFEVGWERVAPRGRIFSWERVWHPVHPALRDGCPYVVLLVELPHADDVRMVGNLAGDPRAEVRIGAPVEAVFEDHEMADPPYTLVQWRMIG
jgi:uncharacterized OB-fold protein